MSRAKGQELLCMAVGPFGAINFPYHRMGKIDSADLFGPTELEIFAIYWHNRERWKKTLDIGGNLGLHTILMAKLGMAVKTYEPDASHFEHLTRNLVANNIKAHTYRVAVHTFDGSMKFIRVLDNLTGNHLDGYKDSYGPREEVTVPVIDCRRLWGNADFAKIDCEGNEHELCKTMTAGDMAHLSVVLEVRNSQNAGVIFEHFMRLQVPMWSQKTDWQQVGNYNDMPHKNIEGSVFIGHRRPFA